MKVEVGYPPNYEAVAARFNIRSRDVVFTYGQILYNPSGGDIPRHLMAHEETHARQQAKLGIEAWWELYLANDHFRLEQELEAYRAQYADLQSGDYDRPYRRMVLAKISKDLAGPIYGSLITKDRAKELITEGG